MLRVDADHIIRQVVMPESRHFVNRSLFEVVFHPLTQVNVSLPHWLDFGLAVVVKELLEGLLCDEQLARQPLHCPRGYLSRASSLCHLCRAGAARTASSPLCHCFSFSSRFIFLMICGESYLLRLYLCLSVSNSLIRADAENVRAERVLIFPS